MTVPAEIDSPIDEAARKLIAEAVGAFDGPRDQRAMALALVRVGGNTLAILAGHETAAQTHSVHARRHTERSRRPR